LVPFCGKTTGVAAVEDPTGAEAGAALLADTPEAEGTSGASALTTALFDPLAVGARRVAEAPAVFGAELAPVAAAAPAPVTEMSGVGEAAEDAVAEAPACEAAPTGGAAPTRPADGAVALTAESVAACNEVASAAGSATVLAPALACVGVAASEAAAAPCGMVPALGGANGAAEPDVAGATIA